MGCFYILAERTVFYMLGKGNCIKPLLVSLLYTDSRPNCTVGKDGVNVEIAFKSLIAVEVWNINFIPYLSACQDTRQ